MKDGSSPLSRNKAWVNNADGSQRETQTMPGFAGSSWYFLRYMDPENEKEPVSKEREQFWRDVDLYVGGAEHATGHLMYARFWQQFLYDHGIVCVKEPFRHMVNQGMIEGVSAFVYRIKDSNTFVSRGMKDQYDTQALHVDIHLVNHDNELDTEAFKNWREEYKDASFITEDGHFYVDREVEKMSKSKYNVVNPDEMIASYGCDAFRMYEMFLGPVEHSKPWSTDGIEGVYRFLRKFWNRFFDKEGHLAVTNDDPTEAELKILHKTLKQVQEDLDRFSLNTCVSQFMIATNELHKMDTRKQAILEPLVILLEPFAPHMAEELWQVLGHESSVSQAPMPIHDDRWLKEDSHEYPVSVNGKVRVKKAFPIDKPQDELEEEVMELPEVKKWVEGKEIKKVVYVPGKIINIVVN
jgi:leucyl-tRNA synthetase